MKMAGGQEFARGAALDVALTESRVGYSRKRDLFGRQLDQRHPLIQEPGSQASPNQSLKRFRRTTVSNKVAPCPLDRLDRVNRNFGAKRPNALWVADFTYVATWAGFVHVAFVIAAFARRIVGWRVSHSAETGFVLDALEQALHDRRLIDGGLVHHSDRGVQGGLNRLSQQGPSGPT